MLISPASDKRISSTLGGLPALAAGAAAADAPGGRGATRARSAAARCGCGTSAARSSCRSKLTDAVPPGVVASEKGAWLATSRTGQTISALVSADLKADLAEGACFNDTRVEVSPA